MIRVIRTLVWFHKVRNGTGQDQETGIHHASLKICCCCCLLLKIFEKFFLGGCIIAYTPQKVYFPSKCSELISCKNRLFSVNVDLFPRFTLLWAHVVHIGIHTTVLLLKVVRNGGRHQRWPEGCMSVCKYTTLCRNCLKNAGPL